MKTVIFLRHWKAEEKWAQIDDRSRKLVQKWEEKTKKYFNAVRDKITRVDAIVSSAARRTKMTAEVIALELDIERHLIQYHSGLWTDDKSTILWMIHSFPSSRTHVILVWHDKPLSQSAMSLTNAPLDMIPKSWLVWLSFSVQDWALVDKKNNTDVWQYMGE